MYDGWREIGESVRLVGKANASAAGFGIVQVVYWRYWLLVGPLGWWTDCARLRLCVHWIDGRYDPKAIEDCFDRRSGGRGSFPFLEI